MAIHVVHPQLHPGSTSASTAQQLRAVMMSWRWACCCPEDVHLAADFPGSIFTFKLVHSAAVPYITPPARQWTHLADRTAPL